MKRKDRNAGTSSSRKKSKKKNDTIDMNFCNKVSIKLMLTSMKKSKSDQQNIASSPMSINLLLNMLAVGFEEGSTGQIQLMNALGFTSVDEINLVSSRLMMLMTSDSNGEPSFEGSAEHKELMNALDNKGGDGSIFLSSRILNLMSKHATSYGKPSLVMANGVWSDCAYTFKPQFVEFATEFYQSCIGTLDFSDEKRVVKEVNSWAKNRTNGLIRDFISQDMLSNEGKKTVLILANSLYFKAAWEKEFYESMTKVEKFYLLDGTTIEVPFMKSTRYQFYRSLDGFKLLRLPYRSVGDETRNFSMYLFVPELKNGLRPLLKRFKLDPSLVHTKCKSRVNCITWIPKFNILFDFKPLDITKTVGLDLSEMGMLTNMIDIPKGAEGYVSKVIQKSYIEVNEKGTKAASAACGYFDLQGSLGEGPPPPPPVRFVADCPFFFMIKDEVSGAVLFSGIVRNPLLS